MPALSARRPFAALSVLLAAVATAVVPAIVSPAAAATSAPALSVSGNRIVTATGAPVRVLGVNRSGSEYACVQGWGLFDGPVDDTSVAAIASWGVNTVRIPLNEDCWLGINGVNPAYAGANYVNAIAGLVGRLHAHGLAAILDLHWSAPGGTPATGQQPMPDADHSPAFWTSVATTFRADPSVAFEVFNEPRDVSWSCWRNGCTTAAGWPAAGMQSLVDAVRATGATQPVIVDGLNWGGDLSGWLANAPSDPAHALVAGWHLYNFSGCNTSSCWDTTAAPVAAQVPVLLTEVGENDCGSSFLDQLLPWADAHGVGYLGWAWDTAGCGSGPALVSDYAGTPTAYGAGFKAHVAVSAATPLTVTAPTPTPTPTAAPLDPSARFDFEDGTTQGWAVRWGSTATVCNESGTAVSGDHGLAVDVTGNGYPAVGTDSDVADITAGAVVRYRVWAPSGVAAQVAPMVLDGSWKANVLSAQQLAAGWNTVTFTVPTTVASVKVLGLQVNEGSGWTGRLVVDDVAVAPVRADFEAGTTQGWGVRWGSTLTVTNESGTAYTGSHGLALTLAGSGYPAAGTTAVSVAKPGELVTYRVWAPSGVNVSVSPIVFDGSWHVTVLAAHPLAPGWNTVQFCIPAVVGVNVLGLQVNDGIGWKGRLVVDTVAF